MIEERYGYHTELVEDGDRLDPEDAPIRAPATVNIGGGIVTVDVFYPKSGKLAATILVDIDQKGTLSVSYLRKHDGHQDSMFVGVIG